MQIQYFDVQCISRGIISSTFLAFTVDSRNPPARVVSLFDMFCLPVSAPGHAHASRRNSENKRRDEKTKKEKWGAVGQEKAKEKKKIPCQPFSFDVVWMSAPYLIRLD